MAKGFFKRYFECSLDN